MIDSKPFLQGEERCIKSWKTENAGADIDADADAVSNMEVYKNQ